MDLITVGLTGPAGWPFVCLSCMVKKVIVEHYGHSFQPDSFIIIVLISTIDLYAAFGQFDLGLILSVKVCTVH